MKFATHFFSIICLFAIRVVNAKTTKVHKNVVPISLDAVAVLINCHEKFIRQGIPLPRENPIYGFYLMEPYFKIEEFFVNCLNEKKKEIPSIEIITKLYAKYIGGNEWVNGQKASLELLRGEYYQIVEEKDKNKKLERWRMGVVGLGLAVRHLHYFIANKLMRQREFMQFVKNENALDDWRYAQMEIHIRESLNNLLWILSVKSELEKNKDFTFEEYKKNVLNRLNVELGEIIVTGREGNGEFSDFWFKGNKGSPKVKRILWVVRHAQRLDNVYPEKYKGNRENEKEYSFNGRQYWWDNSPLSSKGKTQQAPTLRKVFSQIPIHFLFSSPLERTIETSMGIFEVFSAENIDENLQIKLEPGFLERLDGCRIPPSYNSCGALQREHPKLDCNYPSLYTKILENGEMSEPLMPLNSSKLILPSEKEGITKNENDCIDRVKNTLNYILKYGQNYGNKKENSLNENIQPNSWIMPGEENAENIVVVSHGAPIGAIHQIISGQWSCVAQTSISKFVEFENTEEPSAKYYSEYEMKGIEPGIEAGEFKNFRLVYTSETKHLEGQRTAF